MKFAVVLESADRIVPIRLTISDVPGHEEHRGRMLSRSQRGHRVPALLSAERIEGRAVHDRTAGCRRGQ
jgi:hypothetical protein